jgi:hypothetical protein
MSGGGQALDARVLALAGLAQALGQVRRIAETGQAEEAVVGTALDSVFRIDADSPEGVYGDAVALEPGLRHLREYLAGRIADPLLPRIALSVLQLERRFVADAALGRRVRDGILAASPEAHGRLLRHQRPPRRQRQVLRLPQPAKLGERFDIKRLPFSMKILLENLLRHEDGVSVTKATSRRWRTGRPKAEPDTEIAFMPARVVLQDFTGVPCVVDLAAMRDAVTRARRQPQAQINPLIPPSWSSTTRCRSTCSAAPRRSTSTARSSSSATGALQLPALGPEGVRQLQGGAAQHRHRPPGEPGEPGPRGDSARDRRRGDGLPGHRVRHRFATPR